MSFTICALDAVEDSAVRFGMGDVQEARFAQRPLEAVDTGLALMRVKPGRRQAFAHRHEQAEEVYVVLSGSGTIKVGEETHPVKALDAIRISPEEPRGFEAGPEGLTFLAVGPHHAGDGALVPDFWA